MANAESMVDRDSVIGKAVDGWEISLHAVRVYRPRHQRSAGENKKKHKNNNKKAVRRAQKGFIFYFLFFRQEC